MPDLHKSTLQFLRDHGLQTEATVLERQFALEEAEKDFQDAFRATLVRPIPRTTVREQMAEIQQEDDKIARHEGYDREADRNGDW